VTVRHTGRAPPGDDASGHWCSREPRAPSLVGSQLVA